MLGDTIKIEVHIICKIMRLSVMYGMRMKEI